MRAGLKLYTVQPLARVPHTKDRSSVVEKGHFVAFCPIIPLHFFDPGYNICSSGYVTGERKKCH